MQVELALDAQAALGEGPAWCEREGLLYWVDILGKRVHAGAEVLLQLDDYVGCAAPRRGGGLALTLSDGFYEWTGTGRELTRLASVEGPAGLRFNDGKCDPAGRFLAGNMDLEEKASIGTLYSLTGRGLHPLLGGLGIPNGLAWSRDGKTLYFIDTPTRRVRAFEYDPADGSLGEARTVVTVPPELGWPDGMTSDAAGRLWVAMWGGGQVTQWDPETGRLLRSIPIPAPHTTSCVFGGPGLNVLYVTSARKGLSAAQLREHPLSGGLFRVVMDVEGMPTWEFNPLPGSLA